MSHLDPTPPATTRELRNFGHLVGGAFLVIAAIMYWRQRPIALIGSFAAVGAVLGLAAFVAPARLSRAYAIWMRLALVLSKVTTPIFMGVVYFGVLTPIGLLMRAVGRNPLGSRTSSSDWVVREPGARQSSLERQF